MVEIQFGHDWAEIGNPYYGAAAAIIEGGGRYVSVAAARVSRPR